MKFGSGLFVCSHMQLGEILKAKAHHGTTQRLAQHPSDQPLSQPSTATTSPAVSRNWLTAKCQEFGSCRTRSFGDTAQHNVIVIIITSSTDVSLWRTQHGHRHLQYAQHLSLISVTERPLTINKTNRWRLAATLCGSRPGVQSASLIMTSLMTSNSETIRDREKRRPPRPTKSSELSNGENHIALRQLLKNRKLHHLWRHNLGSRWKLQKKWLERILVLVRSTI